MTTQDIMIRLAARSLLSCPSTVRAWVHTSRFAKPEDLAALLPPNLNNLDCVWGFAGVEIVVLSMRRICRLSISNVTELQRFSPCGLALGFAPVHCYLQRSHAGCIQPS